MKRLVIPALWMALCFGFFTLFFYIVLPQKTWILSILGALTLVNLLFVLLVEWSDLKRGLKTRTALYGMNTFVLTIIVLGILVFANLLFYRHKERIDFTETDYFTLAPQTRKIVSHLPREVQLTAFFQTDAPEKSEFEILAAGYQELTDKIDLTFVDPDKNPAITKQYGVTTYGTVVLESGKKETKIKDPTEENLTNGFFKVTRDETKTIYFIHGHGENPIDGLEKNGYSMAKKALEKDGYQVKKLLLLKTGEIPDDAAVVILAGPRKAVLPKEQKILQQYLNQGGSLLVLADPKSDFGMEEFLSRWGVELGDDIVIDPMSKLFGGDFAAPVVSQYTFHDITKDFTLATIFPVLRSVRAQTREDLQTAELLQTGPNSWAETDFDSSQVKFHEGEDQKGPIPIAVVATKTLGSSEDDPNPKDTPIEEETVGESNLEKSADAESKGKNPDSRSGKARLVVIGDSDFANNTYFNFSGNGDLFLNTTSWLAEEENLISIRPRERKNTPLQLTQATGSAIFIMGTIFFPACVVIAGLRTWWRRRQL